MEQKIMILLDSMEKYPQKLHETESLNIKILSKYLTDAGYQVTSLTYNNFTKIIKEINISEYLFLYASSQYTEYKEYIEDILLSIINSGGRIIPDFLLFRSHENKAFQELYKLEKDINSPNFSIIATYEEGINELSQIKFPIIGKTVDGFGSKGVVQINNISEGKRFLSKTMSSGIAANSAGLRNLARRIKYKNQYPKKRGKLLLQEKIDNVDHDWKILVFGDMCFCLKRSVKKNDFRASGSGIFDFNAKPTDRILDFAVEIRKKLATPWVSLDIIEKEKNCYLIEYQAVHFGLSTMINNKIYYQRDKNSSIWKSYQKEHESEYYFAIALDNFVKYHIDNNKC